MIVWVVVEECRGLGPSVVGVFDSKDKAEKACYGSYCFVVESFVE